MKMYKNLIVISIVMACAGFISPKPKHLDDLLLSVYFKKNRFYYSICNNSSNHVLVNIFSGDNRKNFRISIYDEKGSIIIDSCSVVRFYEEQYLSSKKNYKLIKSGDCFRKELKLTNCDFLERLKKNNKSKYKVILSYSFDGKKYKNPENNILLQNAWSGELTSDTLKIQ